jgi:hypothetical protein
VVIAAVTKLTPAQQFLARFDGLPRAHGHFRPEGPERERDGKQKGFAETIHAPVTEALWEGHLAGVYGIGIVPIKDDGMCRWGAIDIDIDKHPIINTVANDVLRRELPLVVCRSKSGGVHLYLFMSEDAPASLVRAKLMEWSVALGYSGVEVFPKQVRLAGPRDYGNWINLPYFNGDNHAACARYAVRHDGSKLTIDEFLALADTLALSISELKDIGLSADVTCGDLLSEAPPCLQSIAGKGGAGDGNSNKMMFNIGVYLRKRHGDMWEQYFDQYNNDPFISTPRGHKEMSGLVRSINRKSYEYTCNESPIAHSCNRQICLTRKFGIGGQDDDPGVVFGSLCKIDTNPPAWIWDVDGARIELTTEQLKDQGRFHTACIEVINKWPAPMKPAAWSNLIREKLSSVEILEAPPDASPEGAMWQHLQTYTTSHIRARSRDELIDNKPWSPTAEESARYGEQVTAGRVYFRANHFKAYLEQQRMSQITERRIWSWLRDRGAMHHQFNIGGRIISCWSIEQQHDTAQQDSALHDL